tara:strand:- start:1771 stop:2307 length:537 start_codon:yes stop_codon:yes gene_type:complete
MSVLSNSTHFNLTNNSTKFLHVYISADQQSSFRINHSSSLIKEHSNEVPTHTVVSWLVDSVKKWSQGNTMRMVDISLSPKNTVQCDINCNGALEFTTTIANVKGSDGSLVIPPESQGCELDLFFSENVGIAYTKQGDVALNVSKMYSRTLVIPVEIKSTDDSLIDLDDNIPATCNVLI